MKKEINIPEAYDDWNLVSFNEIKEGNFLAYVSKPFTYKNGEISSGGFKRGGYVTKVGYTTDPSKRFIGLKNKQGVVWTISDKNIQFYLISPK